MPGALFGKTPGAKTQQAANCCVSPDQLSRPVPAGLPACDGVRIKSNLTVTVTGPNSSDAAQICVLP